MHRFWVNSTGVAISPSVLKLRNVRWMDMIDQMIDVGQSNACSPLSTSIMSMIEYGHQEL